MENNTHLQSLVRQIPPEVLKIIAKFEKSNAEIYIVGGAVRDLLMGRAVSDWDFTTNLTPEKMAVIFPKNSFCNNKFGTFSIVGCQKNIYEVTTFRTDQGYSDSRHPDAVKWGKTLEEDLMRRDFTINAIALLVKNPLSTPKLEIIDPYDGQKDLKNGLLKTVGSADQRFQEDSLRMIRAVRIASQISFIIEENTFQSIVKNAAKIKLIAFERVRDEILKILKSPSPADGIKLLRNSGLLAHIMPEILSGVGIAQKGHHIDDVWNHSLKTLNCCSSQNPITRLACLLHDVAKPQVMVGQGEERTFHNHEVVGARIAKNIGQRLRLSSKELDLLFRLVRWHMFTASEIQTDKAVRRFIRNVTPEYIDEMISLRRADRLGSGAKETSWRWELFKKRIVEVQKQPFSVKDLKINGHQIMELLDLKPGPKVGQILQSLFTKVESNPKLNTPSQLRKIASLLAKSSKITENKKISR